MAIVTVMRKFSYKHLPSCLDVSVITWIFEILKFYLDSLNLAGVLERSRKC